MSKTGVYAAFVGCLLAASRLAAQDSETAPQPGLHWVPVPALLPGGARMAIVEGDPLKPVPLRILISMPDGYRVPPHFHAADERVEVRQGTFLVGMGDQLDPGKMVALAVGDTGTAPARMHHFAAAKGPTIVSVTMMGPYVITYVNPNDEPWSTFPYGY